MVGLFIASTSMMLISLIGTIFAVSPSTLFGQWTVFAQAGNSTGSVPLGSLARTNLDIPSLDFTLPDGSSTSADFRSIYFDSVGKTMYAYYSDYGLPENKPTLKAGDKFTVDAYLAHQNTPSPSSIDITISKIASGGETGNFTQMKLDNPVNITSSGNMYLVPNTAPGNYILDTFVKYPFGGIVMVYTMEIQIAA
ncbi:MAG TPA: hypothetical protein VIP56_00580 [Nitrososphaeraceae archaeon]